MYNWLIGSDPGLLRLRSASRTTAGLALALLILDLLTRATGQPVSVAMLGAVIAMNSSMAVNEPDRRQRRITMMLLPVPASLAITLGALLAPHRVAADAAFVAVIFIAIYGRRFGSRGGPFGMVAFMTYFFALFLHAKAAEVPWLVAAIVIGTACSFAISSYLLPDRPGQVVRRSMQSLRLRTVAVVDAVGDALQAGRLDGRYQRRLRSRTARFKEAAVMVQTQLEDLRSPETAAEGLTPPVFDTALAVERLAAAGARAAVCTDIPDATRAGLIAALRQLAVGLSADRDSGSADLRHAAEIAGTVVDQRPGPDVAGAADIRRLALAVTTTSTAAQALNAPAGPVATRHEPTAPTTAPGKPAGAAEQPSADRHGFRGRRSARDLRPTTRQAIQGAIAASLAIVVGELVSPARWYWAVIAAFMVFTGTTSWGQTLTKGWQRLLGTMLGVPAGMLVATAVSGNTVFSMVLIFGCLFCAMYFRQVAYSLMIFWITTLLAVLYGLLGEFSIDLLVLRIEETAIGAAIGVVAAIVVLPTHTRASIRNDARVCLTTLSDLIDTSVVALVGGAGGEAEAAATAAAATARRLDRELEQFRVTAKPLSTGLAGFAGVAGRRSTRRSLQMLTACDYHARTLVQCSQYRAGQGHRHRQGQQGQPGDTAMLSGMVTAAAGRARRNIRVLVDILDGHPPGTVLRATDLLDAADALTGHPSAAGRLHTALRALRQIDCAIVDAATDAGAAQADPLGVGRPPDSASRRAEPYPGVGDSVYKQGGRGARGDQPDQKRRQR